MILRSIQETDLAVCAALFTNVFSSDPWNEEWNETFALERLLHFYQSKGFVGILAEQQGVVGFALGNTEPFYFGSMFYLREMCTKTNLQNQGVGNKVLKALEKELIPLKVQSIYLTTERTIPAAHFYQTNGFNYSEKMGFYAKRVSS